MGGRPEWLTQVQLSVWGGGVRVRLRLRIGTASQGISK